MRKRVRRSAISKHNRKIRKKMSEILEQEPNYIG